jgi:hypothetical protein
MAVSSSVPIAADTNAKIVSEIAARRHGGRARPGGDKTMISAGGEIQNTQDAIPSPN